MSSYILPLAMGVIVVYGLRQGIDVFSALRAGALKGLSVCREIFPTVLVMLTLMAMLRAAGVVDVLSRWLAPVIAPLGIPPDCLPLMLLRPFSGSGALSLGSEVMKAAGPDSLSGRMAAVMLGASETSVYTLAIYGGYLGLKDTRYALPAALISDAAAFITAGIAVRLLM